MLAYYQVRPDETFGFTSYDAYFPPHMHVYLEFFYVLEGTLQITVNGQTKIMTKGDLAVVFPNCIHSRESIPPNLPVAVAVVGVKPERTGDFNNIILNFVPEDPFLSWDMVPDEVFDAILRLLKLSAGEKKVYESVLFKSYIQIILGFIIPYLNLTKKCQKEYSLIQKSINYILNNFDQPLLSLESLAEDAGVTKNHISASFSNNLGIGFNQYLNNVRLNYALDLMRNTDQSITEIAFACGFGTLRTFNRVFKKNLDITPSEFRNLQKTSGAEEVKMHNKYI